MKYLNLSLSCLMSVVISTSTYAGGLPVFDGVSIGIDIADNVTEIVSTVKDLQHQVAQISNLEKQITQMDTQIDQMDSYMENFGNASSFGVDTNAFSTDDLKSILDEIDQYKNGSGLTSSDKEENKALFGTIDKTKHTLARPATKEEEYKQYEQVEIEYAAYKKTSESISSKRLALLDHHHALTVKLSASKTDQETSKINSALKANATSLAGLKAEEEAQYRSYQASLTRLQNQEKKELKRQALRKEYNNKEVWQKRKPQSLTNYINVVVNENELK